jgi:flagellin
MPLDIVKEDDMIINHNLSAMFADRSLKVTQTSLTKNMEKLSSGLRINRAGDDASGLAVSEKMRSQIRGLN